MCNARAREAEDLLEQAEESNSGNSHSVLNKQVMMIDKYVPQIKSMLTHNPAESLIPYHITLTVIQRI